jgi:hypothetical protein
MLQPGQKVRFKLRDIHLPSIQNVLDRMTPDTELQGCITLLSDEGLNKAAYAVVEVKGILMPIIVHASCIKVAAFEEDMAVAKSW